MTNVRRYRLDKKRRYAGEEAGRELVDYLNSQGQDRQQVIDLLNDATTLVESLLPFSGRDPEKSLIEIKRSPALYKKIMKARDRLDLEHLARYRVQYWIEPKKFISGERVSEAICHPMPAIAYQIDAVLELIRQDKLLSVRQCQECHRWYFARFSHQEFCTGTCRAKFQTTTEAFKERRREYMRGYYKVQISGKAK